MQIEKELETAVRDAERACQKEERELARIGVLLQDVHKQNAHHLRSEMIKCSQEEDELENHFHQVVKKTANIKKNHRIK